MKAIFCNKLGGTENLAYVDTVSPRPGPNDVLIKVKAAGLNFADTLQIAGKYQSKLEPPFIPGMEVAGEILEIGQGVNRPLNVGQRVMAFMRGGGAFAEEVLVDSEWLVPVPDEMDDVIAAGFPTVYGTSNFALKHRGNLQAGETLLVLGAAGGVGFATEDTGILSDEDASTVGLEFAYTADSYGVSFAYTDNDEVGGDTSFYSIQAAYTPDAPYSISAGYEFDDDDADMIFVGLSSEVGPGTLSIGASTQELADDHDDGYMYELAYSYAVNDGMTVTPGLFIIEDADDDQFGMVVTTSFSF